jgi:hypothetical protein
MTQYVGSVRAARGAAMSARARTLACLLVCAALAIGCRGVGRALVDARPPPSDGAELCSEHVPTCVDDPQPAAPENVPPAAQPVDLLACGAPVDAQCGVAAQAAVGANPAASSCETRLTTDAATHETDALAQRSCDRLHIVDDRRTPDARSLRVEGARLEQVNIVIETVLPLTVELESAWLRHVWFELHGPVTLHIEASRLFSDVRVSAPDQVAGQAALELAGVRGEALSIGSSAAEFRGEVIMRRSTLQGVRIRATAIELESVSMSDAILEGERLDASDATLQRLVVNTRRSKLSVCTVTAARFADCGAFSAIEGTLQGSRIEGCSEGARLYGASFSSGVLDGQIVLDHAELSQVRLGLHERADIQAWDSHLNYVRFCSPAQSVSFGAVSSVTCSRCTGSNGQPRALDACVTSDGTYEAIGGPEACPALVEPQFCADPEPKRMRPPY